MKLDQDTRKLRYVICPETITSPHASRSYPWMPDDAPCALKCSVVRDGAVMEFRCGRGHVFYAMPKDIREEDA
jgi:hypothetical protein